VGTGYVGITTCVILADRGFKVVGIDTDKQRIENLSSGSVPLYEPGIERMLKKALLSKKLEFTTDYSNISDTDVTFVCVGTPPNENGALNMSYVERAMEKLGKELKLKEKYHLVAIRSTLMPGSTSGKLKEILQENSGKKIPTDLGLVFIPEFLREGMAIQDTFHPDCIVIGASDKRSYTRLLSLFRKLYKQDFKSIPIIRMKPVNAEILKVAVNASRAIQISMVNTIADICQKLKEGEISEVTEGLKLIAKLDSRYLGAGLGFGGSCLPKDTRALSFLSSTMNVENTIFESAMKVNKIRIKKLAKEIKDIAGRGATVSILGLAFKANTDDIRESPSIHLIEELNSLGIKVKAYDPYALNRAKAYFDGKVLFEANAERCISESDACIVATAWDEFKKLEPKLFLSLRKKVVFDCRRIYDEKKFKNNGIRLIKIGSFYDNGI
jgi:UDPglucose 6-dehydrogenase